MKTIWTWMQTAITIIGGILGAFLGELDGFLYALIIFMGLDYLSGIFCAFVDKKLSSNIGMRGIIKKLFILVLVGVAHILDTQILGSEGSIIRTAVICVFLSNEGISILENASRAGVPIPAKLKSVLEQLHNHNNDDNQGDE